jgi:rod shape-determining protein MreC
MALGASDSEPRLFYGPGPGLRLLIMVTLSVALLVVDHRNDYLRDLRRYLGAAVHPLQQAVDAPFAAARWARETLAARQRLISENEQLRRERLLQESRLQRMAALESENARLRALLESTAKVGDQVLIAEILSVDMDPLRHRIVLNKGSAQGAFVGQALIDAQGIVGQITRDQLRSAEALLITDPDHAVPVEIVRNGLRTIALGTGDLERLSLPYLARNADVKEGDLLVSSGLGGTFPPGYPVARVTQVSGATGEPFLTVTARPTAALDRIREVLLVWPNAGKPFEIIVPEPQLPEVAADTAQPVEPTATQPAQATAADPAGSESPVAPAAPGDIPAAEITE